jgi:hypothetical protein
MRERSFVEDDVAVVVRGGSDCQERHLAHRVLCAQQTRPSADRVSRLLPVAFEVPDFLSGHSRKSQLRNLSGLNPP